MYLHGSSFVCMGFWELCLFLGENIVIFQFSRNQLLNYEVFRFDHAIGIEFDVSKSSTYRSIILS